MTRFRIARLLGAVLTISVMTGSVALPAMAAEETAVVADEAQETGDERAEDKEETDPEAAAEEETKEEQDPDQTSEENPGGAGADAESAEDEEEAAAPQAGGNREDEAENSGADEAASAEEAADHSMSAPDEESETIEGEETLPVFSAETEVSADSVIDASVDLKDTEKGADVSALQKEEKAGAVLVSVSQSSEMNLSASAAEIQVGQTAAVTATITVTAPSEEALDSAAAAAAESLTWEIDGSGTAAITQTAEVQIVKESTGTQAQQAGAESGSAEAPSGEETSTEEAIACSGTITQTVTVKGSKEGTANVTAMAGEERRSTEIKVNPVPAVLGRPTNFYWKDTTVLTWDKVKNAGQYRVVVSIYEGKKSYAGVITTSSNSCDVEDKIVALIRNYKASFTGASYSVRASVQAISSDTVHYRNGEAASAPGFRYLNSTFQEAVSRNGWFQKGGEWYFYEAGVKQTGWFAFGGKKYYLYQDGRMAHDCWIGKKYLKTSGEMAKDEWVDGYRFYVDKNGDKDEKLTFVSRLFFKTAKGWHYKRTNGKPEFKNTWASIFNRMYYFDADGVIRTGFFNVGGKRYFADYTGTPETGLGARKTGWVTVPSGTYWFDDGGVMQRSSWVDKKQYYVDPYGHKIDWITYNNLRNVNTSNRLGYHVYNSGSDPEQSIAGYETAYKKGNRIMVVDLRFTKDNVPVCFHDDLIEYARLRNGSVPENRPSVSKSTLSQLNAYDYGIKWGSKYSGTKVLTLDQMAAWIAKHKDAELYIEVKTAGMNATQIQKTLAVLNKYKIVDNSSMIFDVSAASDTRAQRVHSASPSLRIGITTSSVNDVAVTQIKKAKGADNEVFMWCWETTGLTADKVNMLRSLNVQYECGTFTTLDQILGYYSKGKAYSYNSGVETEGAVFHQLLRAATMHEKAKWEKTAKGWKYKLASGNYVRSRWMTIAGKKYYFTGDAIMKTGWMSQSGKLYYFDSSGAMATGNKTINGHVYQFGADGVFVKKVK